MMPMTAPVTRYFMVHCMPDYVVTHGLKARSRLVCYVVYYGVSINSRYMLCYSASDELHV